MKPFSKIILFLSVMALPFVACKKDEDPCENVNCLNGGTCNNGTCTCPAGYTGSTCGTEMRAQFLGTYTVSEACTSGNWNYTMGITNSASGVQNIIMTNFGGFSVNVSGTVNGNALSIPSQLVTISGVAVTISGSGQINGNILTFNYTAAAGVESDSCTATCTKQ